MLTALKLLLPAILPSWNFFDIIAPSPRIQYALLNADHLVVSDWCEFRPRPKHVSFWKMLRRMLWNPRWNESLFMMSCAERIMEQSTPQAVQHSEREILERIYKDLIIDSFDTNCNIESELQFRLELIQRHGGKIENTICFYSSIATFESLRAKS